MRARKSLLTCVALAAFAAGGLGCGAGGGSSDGDGSSSAGAATVQGTVERASLPRAGAGSAPTPVTVAAVDGQGTVVDRAANVTGEFALRLPWGRDYVVVFSDSRGVIGALVHGEPEQAAFAVTPGVSRLEIGTVQIDLQSRRVRLKEHGRIGEPPHLSPLDGDGDGIPDQVDDDRDNDGIPNASDVGRRGEELSRDHDNDGVGDQVDSDDDNDGIPDVDDGHPGDRDDDGVDDDRDGGPGDPAVGARIWAASCAGCHAAGLEELSVKEIAEALAEGEDDMPAFPSLVSNAEDIVAYLRGDSGGGTPPPPPATDTDRDGVPDSRDRCPTVAGTGSDGCPVTPTRPAALGSTCLNCHGDWSASVRCASAAWQSHRARVGSALYDEVSTWATGGVCP